ncbi:MAG: polysaccharide deacetylase family protein [Ginsengibacter sp.]
MLELRKKIRKLKKIFYPRAVILMYHRIGPAEVDPWQLAVSEEHFEAHLLYLQKKNFVIPLPQLVAELKEGHIRKKCVAITFDDGYLDNYQNALPLLKRYNLPATFFITSKNIDTSEEFWWDELENIFLQTAVLPEFFSGEINGEKIEFLLGADAVLTDQMRVLHKHYYAYGPGTKRTDLYCRIWEILSPLPAAMQSAAMEKIRIWSGINPAARNAYTCMNSGNVSAIAQDKLFEIGGHTKTHPALASHGKNVQEAEIIDNITFLEKITGNKISLFAYPSGKFNEATLDILSSLHIDGAFVTKERTVSPKSNLLTLGRFQVNDWNAEEFHKKISRWFEYED